MTSLESNKKYKADVEKGDATTETQRDQKISTTERDECYCMLSSKEVTKETTFSNQETKAKMSISLPVEEPGNRCSLYQTPCRKQCDQRWTFHTFSKTK